jgi:hypothetical protein
MGTFATNSNHRLPFTICQPRKKKNFRFLFPFAADKHKFSVSISICNKQMELLFSVCGITETWRHGHGDVETWRHGDMEMETWKHGDIDMETWKHGKMETWRHGDMDMETWTLRHGQGDVGTSNGKQKPRRFSVIRLLFAHRANGSLPFIHLLTKKQTEVIHLQTDSTE